MQQIRERWHLARSILRYGSAGQFISIIVRGILKPLVEWRTFCFFERNLAEPVAPFEASIPLEVRIATDADFDRFHDMLTWLLRRPVWLPALGATLEIGADEAYAHFSYTDPAVRGRRVQPAVTNFMIRWERSVGIQRHFYFVMGHNASAMRITSGHHVGSAARPSRTVRTVRLLGARGFLAVGLRGEQRPRLEPGPHVDLGRFGLWIRA